MSKMRTTIVALVTAGCLVGLAVEGPARAGAAEWPFATAETLLGAWNGQWLADGRERRGPMGLVLARSPGTNEVVGQFTFITGGVTRSLRYEGRIDNGRVEFPLVGDGQIVLEPVDGIRPGTAARLRGTWTDERGALPAPQGMIELGRAS
jgi:hypothetical protein